MLGLCVGVLLIAYIALGFGLRSRWGLALRALRDSPARAASLGLYPLRLRAGAFACSGLLAGLAGALYVFAKGTVAPDVLAVHQSVAGLVMVLMGGVNSLTGALTGAALWTVLQDNLIRSVPYWRAALGGVILLLVMLLPMGLSGWAERLGRKKGSGARYV